MNKLGKHVFVVLFMLCFCCTAFAQRGRMRDGEIRGGRIVRPGYGEPLRQQPYANNRMYSVPNPKGMSRVQVVKEHFIGRQLSLSSGQAERFWPLYRRYQIELSQVRILKRQNTVNATGAEQIRKDLEYDTQLDNIKKHYTDEFLKILPPDKVSQLYKSERGFTDELIKNLNERNNAVPQQ